LLLTTIFINTGFELLEKACKKLDENKADERRANYLAPIAYGICRQHLESRSMSEEHHPTDIYTKSELYRMAEAVLSALDPIS